MYALWRVAYYFVHPTFFMVWYSDLWCGLHEVLCYCCSFEYYTYVCIFEQIGDFSYFWAMVCECGPDLAYVGQTSRDLRSRFREHIRYMKNDNARSTYALHILNCRHEYGNINDTPWHFSNRSINQISYFHMNKCTYSRYTTITNSSPNSIQTNLTPYSNYCI
jgi:hypothetical protein